MELRKHIDVELQKPGVVPVFGLILFTDRHPHLAKVLRDPDYWNEFSAISGEHFAIFSACPAAGSYKWPDLPDGMIGMMIPTWIEPKQNNALLSTFHLNSTEHLPKFVVFAEVPNNGMCQCSINLTDESTEKAYAELKKVITAISDAANNISLKSRADTITAYGILETAVKNFKFQITILKAVKAAPFMSKIFTFCRSLLLSE